ncbi:MAG: class I SAM-dependent methyltransferase [Phycisphaerales bacterium]
MAERREDDIAENYQYWRDHGASWVEEYAKRKRVRPLYHIQELMLREYFTAQAPARVLEFGCGVGRHLRYLREVEDLEIHGFDQSESMVAGCREWADDDWIGRRITVGEPAAPLPFADDAFDIVYSAEVLVHVRPEDLSSTLQELLRVARGQVFHLETSARHEVQASAHEGCWKHDLVGAYAELGYECEVLPSGYFVHDPYRVVLSAEASGDPGFVWPEWRLRRYREMETALLEGIEDLARRRDSLQERLDGWKARALELESQIRTARRGTMAPSDEGAKLSVNTPGASRPAQGDPHLKGSTPPDQADRRSGR